MLFTSAWTRLIFSLATTLIIFSPHSAICSNQVQPTPMSTIWHSYSLFEVPDLFMATHSLPLVLVTHTLPAGWLDSLKNSCRTLTGPQDATVLSLQLSEHPADADGLFALLTIRVDHD